MHAFTLFLNLNPRRCPQHFPAPHPHSPVQPGRLPNAPSSIASSPSSGISPCSPHPRSFLTLPPPHMAASLLHSVLIAHPAKVPLGPSLLHPPLYHLFRPTWSPASGPLLMSFPPLGLLFHVLTWIKVYMPGPIGR